MGHLNNPFQGPDGQDAYFRLRHRLDQGHVRLPEPDSREARRALYDFLRLRFTSEEAELAAGLPFRPSTVPELSALLNRPQAALESQLNTMAEKGLVMDLPSPDDGLYRYVLLPAVVGFFEFTLMRRQEPFDQMAAARLLHAYAEEDPTFARSLFGEEAWTVVGRALVSEEALSDGAEVLDHERASSILEGAERIAVALCFCRHQAEHMGRACATPQELCMSLDDVADFVVRRRFAREISLPEARELIARSREMGLVQIGDNVEHRPMYICNCCACCCGQLVAIRRFGLSHAVMTSNFIASIDQENCRGCGRCARRCPIQAIHLEARPVEGSRVGRMTAQVEEEVCLGCGVCVAACKHKALTMMPRQQRVIYPRDTVERVVRMALERGNLANLLAEAAGHLPTLGVWRLVGAILRLPPVKARLAAKGLGSVFFNAIVDQARKDPSMAVFRGPR